MEVYHHICCHQSEVREHIGDPTRQTGSCCWLHFIPRLSQVRSHSSLLFFLHHICLSEAVLRRFCSWLLSHLEYCIGAVWFVTDGSGAKTVPVLLFGVVWCWHVMTLTIKCTWLPAKRWLPPHIPITLMAFSRKLLTLVLFGRFRSASMSKK